MTIYDEKCSVIVDPRIFFHLQSCIHLGEGEWVEILNASLPLLNLGLDHHCCTGIFPSRIQFVASRIVWPCPQLYCTLPGLYVSSSLLLLYSLSPVYFLVPDWFFLSIDWIDRILTLFSSNAKTFETWSRHFFGDLYFLLFFMKM